MYSIRLFLGWHELMSRLWYQEYQYLKQAIQSTAHQADCSSLGAQLKLYLYRISLQFLFSKIDIEFASLDAVLCDWTLNLWYQESFHFFIYTSHTQWIEKKRAAKIDPIFTAKHLNWMLYYDAHRSPHATLVPSWDRRVHLDKKSCGRKDCPTSTTDCLCDVVKNFIHFQLVCLKPAWGYPTACSSSMPRVVPPIDGKTNNLSSSLIESTAGFTAGIVATLVVHPFDILKTRLQCPSPFHWSYLLKEPNSDKLQSGDQRVTMG
jgi:hypothetical protein